MDKGSGYNSGSYSTDSGVSINSGVSGFTEAKVNMDFSNTSPFALLRACYAGYRADFNWKFQVLSTDGVSIRQLRLTRANRQSNTVMTFPSDKTSYHFCPRLATKDLPNHSKENCFYRLILSSAYFSNPVSSEAVTPFPTIVPPNSNRLLVARAASRILSDSWSSVGSSEVSVDCPFSGTVKFHPGNHRGHLFPGSTSELDHYLKLAILSDGTDVTTGSLTHHDSSFAPWRLTVFGPLVPTVTLQSSFMVSQCEFNNFVNVPSIYILGDNPESSLLTYGDFGGYPIPIQ